MSGELIAAALAQHEATIERSLTDGGKALGAIRDQRLYLASHETFEDYCRDRWNFSYQRAHQMITAASVVSTIVESGLPAPANEAQARELARVPEPEREQVWRETLARTDGKPTAAAVREVAEPEPERLTVEREPDYPAPQPVRRDSTPDEIEDDRQRRYTASLGDVLVSVWALLDPDPGVAVKRSWRREHSVHVGLPLQADRFTADGIRHTAELLSALADHVEQNGGAL